MDLGIWGFRNYELFKLVVRILNWRILQFLTFYEFINIRFPLLGT